MVRCLAFPSPLAGGLRRATTKYRTSPVATSLTTGLYLQRTNMVCTILFDVASTRLQCTHGMANE